MKSKKINSLLTFLVMIPIIIGIITPFSVQGQAPPPPPPPPPAGGQPAGPPPDNTTPPVDKPASDIIPCTNNCGFVDLIVLVKNMINLAIKLSIPVATGVIAWQGFILMTTGVVDKKTEARKALGKVLIGFGIILAAWLIVSTILKALLASDFLQAVPLQLSMITAILNA